MATSLDHSAAGVTFAPNLRAARGPTASGKVLWHFTMTLDGYVAGPNHSFDWMDPDGIEDTSGIVDAYAATTGAILCGRSSYDVDTDISMIYAGQWSGPVFVLTHHPEDAPQAPGVTIISCDVADAVRIGLEAAGGKNLEIFSADIGRQLIGLGLIDEIHLHIAPILLGDGIRLYSNPGGSPVQLELINGERPKAEVNMQYRPVRAPAPAA